MSEYDWIIPVLLLHRTTCNNSMLLFRCDMCAQLLVVNILMSTRNVLPVVCKWMKFWS